MRRDSNGRNSNFEIEMAQAKQNLGGKERNGSQYKQQMNGS